MNTDSGALSFDANINNEKLIESINETEKRIKGFSDAVVMEGENIDGTFENIAENIKTQKDVIANLEAQLKTLNSEIDKMAPGKAQAELRKQASLVEKELKAETEALKQLENQVEATEEKHVSYRTQLRMVRDEMIQMEAAGKRDSEAYRELQRRAGELKDAIGDAQAQMSIMADDERIFKGVVSTIGGLTGAFSAAQGAVVMFSDENENLQKIMLKVQSLMAITIGLQQVAEMLNKDSYFSVVILTKAKELLAVAETKVATAMGITTASARVLMATLTLGLSVAITAVVVMLSKLQSKSAEAKKSQEEFNKSVAESAFKPIAAIEQLASSWNSLGDSISEKQKFIDDNADKFNELGVSITNVNDAENLLVKNKDAFKQAMIEKAKSMAAFELGSQKYKEVIQKQLEYEELVRTGKNNTTVMQDVVSAVGSAGSYQMPNTSVSNYNAMRKAYTEDNNKKILEEIKNLEKSALTLFEMQMNFSNTEKQILEGLGYSSEAVIEGSISAVNEEISRLNKLYENASTDSQRSKYLLQLVKQQELLASLDKRRTEKEKKEKYDAAKEIEQITLSVNENTEKMLHDQKAESIEKRLEQINLEKKNELNAIEEKEKAIVDAYNKNTGKSVKSLSEIDDENVKTQLQALTDAKAGIEKAYEAKRISEYEKYEQELKEIAIKYADEKTQIEYDYDKEIQNLRELGLKKEAEFLDQEKKKKISELTKSTIEETELYQTVIDERILLSSEMTKQLIDDINKKVDAEVKDGNLSIEDAKRVMNEINKVRANLDTDTQNPFKNLSNAIKNNDNAQSKVDNYNADTASESLAQLSSDAAKTQDEVGKSSIEVIQSVMGIINMTMDALDELGIFTEEEKKTVNEIMGMVNGAVTLTEGIISGNPMQIIEGSIQLIVKGIKLFDTKSKDIEKKQKNLVAEVKKLKVAYEDLERALNKAFSTDAAKIQQQEIENIQAQIKANNEWIEQENRKKKKKRDKEGIEARQRENEDLQASIKEKKEAIIESITGTSVMSAIDQFANAYADAFTKGEDAALKSADVVSSILKNALIEKMKKDLQPGITELMTMISVAMEDGIVTAKEKSDIELKKKQNDITAANNQKMFDDLGLTENISKTSNSGPVSGAIKNITEESANVLAGQTNAIRINQIQANVILRDSLSALNRIADNTSHNVNLKKLDGILKAVESLANSGSSLRSQGL